ncbi:hypothetical protein C5167_008056 [Papaver somniferum]|uniref:Transposase-associated domain-containing protein n=1 Tax=Papaver somniferum TaxID=3469 RepID=A0A4Y7JTF2_PAPSO|nr:hypothetical protein C5167_008056 [Papaver somniferum]
MDKSWVHKDRWVKEYEDGVRLFLDHAFEKGVVTEDSKMKCPCRKCNNVNYKVRSEIFSDLILHGMMRNYTTWFHHGESLSSMVSSSIAPQDTCFEVRNNNDERPGDDLFGMLRAVCGIPMRDNEGMDDRGYGEGMDDMDGDEDMDNGDGGASGLPCNCTTSRFYKFIEESKIPLYPGCEKCQ